MKKHFLLLLMAFMSLTGWAADLVGSKFIISNVTYSESTNPAVVDDDIYTTSDYTIDLTTWYTDEACTTQAKDGEGTAYTINKLPVGKYWVKITGIGTTYSGLTTAASFNVIAIDATISFAAGQKKAWKATEPAAYTYSLKKKGTAWTDTDNDLGLKVGRVAGEDVKKYDFTFEWTNKNYNLTRATGDENQFEITAKNVGSTATVPATITRLKNTMVYTGNNASGIYKVMDGTTELVEGTDWDMAATKNVGTGNTPVITFKGNYTGSLTPTDAFAITAAPITISIDDIEVTYTGVDQGDQTGKAAVKFTYSGIVGDDVSDAAFIKSKFTAPTSVAVDGSAINAGTYTLEITGGNTGTYDGANKNYEFKTYLPGQLTINPIELKLKAKDANKAIGAKDPEFTLATPAGLLGAHSITGVTFTREKQGTDDGEKAGEYKITPNISAAKVVVTATPTTDVSKNYKLLVNDEKGVLTVGKAPITVIILDAEKAYGAADPEFKFKAVGLQEGDDITVEISRDKAGTAAGEKVGAYSLTGTAVNPDESKYSSVSVVDGVFTINKAKLTFAIPAQNVATSATEDDLTNEGIEVGGINNSDVASTLYTLSFGTGVSTATNATFAAGVVATLTADAQKNYVIDEASTNKVGSAAPYVAASGKLIVGTGGSTSTTITLPRVAKADFADDTKNTAAATIATYDGEVVNVTFGDFAMTKEQWYSLVLPFDTDVKAVSEAFGYAVVDHFDKESNISNDVMFKLHMGTLPANEPFILKIYQDKNMNTVTFNAVKIVASKTPSVKDKAGNEFIGTYGGVNGFEGGKQYVFSVSTGDISRAGSSTYLRPLGAYIKTTEIMDGMSAAPRIVIEEPNGETTAIETINVEQQNQDAEGWYNLNGMKLNGAPSQKGVFIKNGKKVIVK